MISFIFLISLFSAIGKHYILGKLHVKFPCIYNFPLSENATELSVNKVCEYGAGVLAVGEARRALSLTADR